MITIPTPWLDSDFLLYRVIEKDKKPAMLVVEKQVFGAAVFWSTKIHPVGRGFGTFDSRDAAKRALDFYADETADQRREREIAEMIPF